MNTTTGQLSRRRALTLLMTATGASVLAACGAPAPPAAKPAATGAAAATPNTASATPVTSTSGAPAEQPKPGGNLRVSAVGDVANIDTQSWGPTHRLQHLHGLRHVDHLRPGPQAPAAAGRELGAVQRRQAAHAASAQGRAVPLGPRADQRGRGLQPGAPAGPETAGQHRLVHDLARLRAQRHDLRSPPTSTPSHISSPVAWPSIFDYLQVLYIVDKDTAQGPITAATKVIGTGPFKFADWVQGQYLRFEKNPNYWRVRQAVPGLGPGQRQVRHPGHDGRARRLAAPT